MSGDGLCLEFEEMNWVQLVGDRQFDGTQDHWLPSFNIYLSLIFPSLNPSS
jgi:hypothetical protein